MRSIALAERREQLSGGDIISPLTPASERPAASTSGLPFADQRPNTYTQSPESLTIATHRALDTLSRVDGAPQ